MQINEFPTEILEKILVAAATINERDGVSYTYGLGQPPMPLSRQVMTLRHQTQTKSDGNKTQRYVRGQIPPDTARWDATSPLRHVCRSWHGWALEYSLNSIYLKLWRGSERWCNLPQRSQQYRLYESASDSWGPFVYRNPFAALQKTAALIRAYPTIASNIRRLWLNSFHTVDTDADIVSVIRSCTNLHSASMPSTVLRRLRPAELQKLLVSETGNELYSLELQSVDLTEVEKKERKNFMQLNPLGSVDFSTLRRLKFIGDSMTLPVTDADLLAIARTATNLEEFHITCLSSISIEGVMAIVEASQQTLRVLEHSPRSQDGFFHPHPGYLPNSDHHICEILASCPRLECLSISIPSMCASLFANRNVRWRGDCQVRAAHLCDRRRQSVIERSNGRGVGIFQSFLQLRQTLLAARSLVETHSRSIVPTELYIELFFLGCIFEPGFSSVHGVFPAAPENASEAANVWPLGREPSRKGPYGSTGLYGKDDAELQEGEVGFEKIEEMEFLRGVEMGRIIAGI